jgi:hypothetical protein
MSKNEELYSWAEGLIANHVAFNKKINAVWQEFQDTLVLPTPTEPSPIKVKDLNLVEELQIARSAKPGEEIYDILAGWDVKSAPAVSHTYSGVVPRPLLVLPDWKGGNSMGLCRICSMRLSVDVVNLQISPESFETWLQEAVDSVWAELNNRCEMSGMDEVCAVERFRLYIRVDNFIIDAFVSGTFCKEPGKIIKEEAHEPVS